MKPSSLATRYQRNTAIWGFIQGIYVAFSFGSSAIIGFNFQYIAKNIFDRNPPDRLLNHLSATEFVVYTIIGFICIINALLISNYAVNRIARLFVPMEEAEWRYILQLLFQGNFNLIWAVGLAGWVSQFHELSFEIAKSFLILMYAGLIIANLLFLSMMVIGTSFAKQKLPPLYYRILSILVAAQIISWVCSLSPKMNFAYAITAVLEVSWSVILSFLLFSGSSIVQNTALITDENTYQL